MYLALSLVAVIGFSVSWYIHKHKQQARPMVCPLQSNCEAVVHSDFSRFAGIPVEFLGLFYYALIALGYLGFWLNPELRAIPWLALTSLTITTVALLFSSYLTFIQAFALREWCTWCLFSASLCLIIFSFSLWASPLNFIGLLEHYQWPILIIHIMALSLGVGGATIADIFFLKFLKDFRISHEENAVLKTLSQIIWGALAVLLVTGASLYLGRSTELSTNGVFILKMLVVGVIIINGAFLNLVISPNLTKISFQEQPHHERGNLRIFRKLALALGAISIVSWYSALVLAVWPSNWSLPFPVLLWGYIALLALAVGGSQIFDQIFSHPQKLSSSA